MPITLGTTSRMPPATPDLAGRPTYSTTHNFNLTEIVNGFVFSLKLQPLDISPGVCTCETHMESELSGEVVHAARVHETQSVSYGLGVQHTLARDWTEAAIRQGSCHHTGTFAGYLNGAQLNKQNKNMFIHRFSDI